jgi:hypothetical protein
MDYEEMDMECKNCGRTWDEDSEQAACIRVYGQCIVCCVDHEKKNGFLWDIQAVLEEQKLYKQSYL